MNIMQSMGNAVLRSIPEKGIYHFDVIIRHMGEPNNSADNTPMQNAIVGTVIVKIRNHEISTYKYPCKCINDKMGITQMLSLGEELAIKQAQEIEKFIMD